MPGEATDITVGNDGSTYIVGNAYGEYKFYKFGNGDWFEYPGGNGKSITVGSDGMPWITTQNGLLYKKN